MGLRILVITLLYVCLLPFQTIFAQNDGFQRFSTKDGLPSNHIYCVFTDADGYVWAGTESGAVRYDGYSFRLFDQTDGLPENQVLNIVQDKQGRIWLRSLNTAVYIQQEKVYHPLPDKASPIHRVNQVYLIRGALFRDASSPTGRQLSTYRNGAWEAISHPKGKGGATKCSSSFIEADGQLWGYSYENLYSYDKPGQKVHTGNLQIRYTPAARHPELGSLLINGNQIIAFDGKNIRRFHPLNAAGRPLGPLLSMLLDSQNDLWLSTSNEGLFRYHLSPDDSVLHPIGQYLRGEIVIWSTEDLEGNIWLGTLRHGLLMMPATSRLISTLGKRDGLASKSVEDIAQDSAGNLYLAHDNNQVSCIRNGKVHWTRSVAKRCGPCNVRELVPLRMGGIAVLADQDVFYMDPQGQSVKLYKSCPKFMKQMGDHFYLGFCGGLQKIHVDSFPTTPVKNFPGTQLYSSRSYAAWADSLTGETWVGTNKELIIVDPETGAASQHPNPNLQMGILAIEEDARGRVWVGTDGNGVVVVDQEEVIHLTREDGLNSNICRTIFHDAKGGVWIGTPGGINYLQGDGPLKQSSIRSIRKNEGLPADEIHAFTVADDQLLVGTNEGLAMLPLDFFEQTKPFVPEVVIEGVQIAEQDTHLLPLYHLSHRQNEILIRFSALAFRARGDLAYRYRMQGLNEGKWIETQARELRFRSLPPGDYAFSVQSKVPGGKWSAAAGFSMQIAPHFTRTGWFWLLCSGFGLLAVIAFTRLRLRTVRRQERRRGEQEKLVLELKLQALRSQMNPHFIFNSLAAIQQFISSSDELSAHKYLSTFSRLIRRVLENSRVSVITLQEELETLKLYLSLEHLRFSDRLNYAVELDPQLRPEQLLIPSMLVQPFVENAIQHGLRHKSGAGQLQIRFQKATNRLMCIVEDDGIGRAAAAAFRLPGTPPSRGLDLAKKRIDSLADVAHTKADIQIQDLQDDTGAACGTRVLIELPLQTK